MEEEACLFSILHMFQGYSALIISVHHTVTHQDYLDMKPDDDNAMEHFLINGDKEILQRNF